MIKLFILTSLFGNTQLFAQSESFSFRTYGERNEVNYTKNGTEYHIEYDGEIAINDDDTDVVSISSGGYLEISKRVFGTERRILIESGRNGNLIRKYFINGKEKPYSPEGKNWLSDVLPTVVNKSSVGAKSRIKRFYEKGGIDSALKAVRKINSNSLKTIYYEIIMDYSLSEEEKIKVVRSAGNTISSNSNLTGLLIRIRSHFFDNDQLISAFVDAAKKIGSDSNLTQLLKEISKDEKVSNSKFTKFLSCGYTINSDSNLSYLLIQTISKRGIDGGILDKTLELLEKEISSSSNASDVYSTIAKVKNLSEEQLMKTLSSASESISSSSNLMRVFLDFSKQVNHSSQRVKTHYIKEAKAISSSSNYRKAVSAINLD